MQRGLLPVKRKDHRTYSFHRTFGAVTPDVLPLEFNFNALRNFPDQNADRLYNGCTAYAQLGMASSEDGQIYDDYDFTYRKTLDLMDAPYGGPCDIPSSLKACTVWGVKKKTETPDQALIHRRGPYFYVERLNGSFFDGLISAMWKKQGEITVGTPWLPWFENIGPDGIVPPVYIDPKMEFKNGHDWRATGVKVINGEQRIICASHQGTDYGHAGECYFSRNQIEALLDVPGSGAFGQKHVTPEDIQKVRMSIVDTIISFIRLAIEKISAELLTLKSTPNATVSAPQPEPEPIAEPVINHPPLLDAFCLAIRDNEGKPGDRNYRNNNPGNARFFSGKYDSKYGEVKCDKDGFAIFSTYSLGWLYLQNLVRSKIAQHPLWTIRDFFHSYAPVTDGNDPEAYSSFVAKRCGVSVDFPIKNLIA